MATVEGIFNEPSVNFVGKDGFFWWVGEIEDNEDPMELGRVKCRVLGYYTNFKGGTVADLPSKFLPWATVLQHTCQAGNDGQGESSGQLQPGAIVMGFFMDGEVAQMPIVIGVMRVQKATQTKNVREFSFTGSTMYPGTAPNPSAIHPADNNTADPDKPQRQGNTNVVAFAGQQKTKLGGDGSPKNLGSEPGIPGSSINPIKPLDPAKPIPVANGVGGPWKTLEYKLSYLIEDLADTSANLIQAEASGYVDIVIGKLVTKEELTARIHNFLSSIFAQIISAMRQGMTHLADELQLSKIIVSSTGVPFSIHQKIQTSVSTILSSLCTLDANITTYTAGPLKAVTDALDTHLASASSKSTWVTKTVDEVVAAVLLEADTIIKNIGDVVKSVKDILKDVDDAAGIVSQWEAAQTIFGVDLFSKNLSDLMKDLIGFHTSGCSRGYDSAKDISGWYPLFGVTRCAFTDLEKINKIRGSNRGDGKGNTGNGLFSALYEDADPYLTSAKNYPNGSYDLWLGTPGRQGEVHKNSNGTTHTSIKFNNSHFAEKVARDVYRKNHPSATEEEVAAAVEEFRKKQATSDTGALVADHISYAGTLTQEVHGDDCKLINGDNAVSIDGDYFLKVTGNCHIEVGGGFFFTAEGAPKSVNKNGKAVSDKIQKHAIKFGSDVDMTVVGAKFELQSTETNLAAISTKITGTIFENNCHQQTMSGIELLFSADSSIEQVTPHLLQLINTEPVTTSKKVTGIRTVVTGGIETVINPPDTEIYKLITGNELDATIRNGKYRLIKTTNITDL